MAQNNIPVSREAHEKNIRELQQYLRELHFSGENVRSVLPDGIYGENTAEAVRDFQKLKGLPPTGETDRATWESIFGSYSDIMDRQQQGIIPFPAADAVLSIGDSGTVIVMLQAMLNTLGGIYFNIGVSEINGIYGKETAQGVSVIQDISGLSPTGKTDIRTWNAVVRLFNSEAEEN